MTERSSPPSVARSEPPPIDDDDALESSLPPLPSRHLADTRPARRPPAHVVRGRRRDAVLRFMGRALLWGALSTVAALLLAPRFLKGDLPMDPALVGTPARSFVRADRDYALVDTVATQAQAEAATARSLPVWDLNTAPAQGNAQALRKGFVRLAVALEGARRDADGDGKARTPGALPKQALALADPVRAVIAGELALASTDAPRDDVWQAWVRAVWFAPAAGDALMDALDGALASPILPDGVDLVRLAPAGLVVRALKGSGVAARGDEEIEDASAVRALAQVRADVAAQGVAVLRARAPQLSAADAGLVAAFVASFVQPTLSTNAAETELRKQKSAEGVAPVIVRARRGEMVLRPGEVISQRHQLLITAMALQQGDDARLRATFGTGAFVALLVLVLYQFGVLRVFRRTLTFADLVFLSGLLVVELGAILVVDAVSPLLPVAPGALLFAVPVALGAMTVRLVLPPDVSLLFAIVAALLGGVVVEPGLEWTVVAIVTSLTGAALVGRSRSKGALLLGGVLAGLAGALTALTLELFRGSLTGSDLRALLLSTAAGGAVSGVLAVAVTPLVEMLFGYVTEQRLHGLADMSHPLLKDLIVHAPGTWHHSVRTAELAEAAARAVGASPLLTRVMALYHDVGKMIQPLAFVENQKTHNVHDTLTPEASAAVLRAHVTEGLALAEKHRLPRAVTAAIEEHHADLAMETFLQKARAAAADQGLPAASVEGALYRYMGRPPQSKESAILLLADQIEAAARALDDPSEERLAELVDALVNRALAADTLAACDLSLRDLGRVRVAFKRALVSFHAPEQRADGGDVELMAADPIDTSSSTSASPR